MICLLRIIVNGEYLMLNYVEIFSKLFFFDCFDFVIFEFVMFKLLLFVLFVIFVCYYIGNEKSFSGWCVDGYIIFLKGSLIVFFFGVSYIRIVCFFDWFFINVKKFWNRRNWYLDIFCIWMLVYNISVFLLGYFIFVWRK